MSAKNTIHWNEVVEKELTGTSYDHEYIRSLIWDHERKRSHDLSYMDSSAERIAINIIGEGKASPLEYAIIGRLVACYIGEISMRKYEDEFTREAATSLHGEKTAESFMSEFKSVMDEAGVPNQIIARANKIAPKGERIRVKRKGPE